MSGIGNSKSASAKSRRNRIIKVAPMTRAVRMALAASLAALALGASGGAFAANCKAPIATMAPCAVNKGIDTAQVVDLTVVHDGIAPAIAAPMFAALAINESDAGDVVIDNSDPISEYGVYGATAISGYSSEGNVDITNHAGADLEATSYSGNAIGIYGYAATGDVIINNAADIAAASTYGLGDGIFASGANVDVTNSGAVDAAGYTWAAGIEAQGSESTTVSNSGDITATASDFNQVTYSMYSYYSDGEYYTYGTTEGVVAYAAGGTAFGIYATGGQGGVAVENSGNITVEGGYTTGIEVQSGGDVTVNNSGDITSGSQSGSYTDSYVYYSEPGVYPFNYVSVDTTYTYGTQVATGINASSNGEGAAVGVTNSGDIVVEGLFGATGIAATSSGEGGSASVTNSGSIYASQYNKYGYGAYGIVVSADGDASIDNSGGIEVYSGGVANGLAALSFAGDASVTNSGDITASSSAGKYYGATGILAFAANGSAYVDNSGSISAYSDGILYTSARAIDAQGQAGVGVTNSGSLYANGKYAYGVYAVSSGGDVSVTNTADGEIGFESSGYGTGILGVASLGDVSIDNAGTIAGYGATQAVGIFGSADAGNVDVSNSGTINSESYYGTAVGVFARASYGTASVDNSGTISADAKYGYAYGVLARGDYVEASNSGDISASGYYAATGIAASSYYGTVVTTTGGSISASAVGIGIGIDAQSLGGDVTVSNAGSIEAVGVVLAAKGINGYAYGNVDIGNTGDIYAGSLYGDAIGIYGYSIAGDVAIGNSGAINAVSYYGLADGIFASGANVGVTNSGAVDVYGYTWAAGIEAQGADSVSVTNSGDISVSAPGFYQAYVYSYLYEAGGVFAYSPGAEAFGIYATGGEGGAMVSNSGNIEVQGGYVTGIEVQSQGDIAIHNSGDIVAGNGLNISQVYYYEPIQALYTYYTGTQIATGINATSNGEGAHVGVTNSGDITAEGIFGASGIAATSGGIGGSASVVNSGNIYASQYVAAGYGAYGIVVSADGNGSISNSGDIAVVSGGAAYGAAALSFAGDASVSNSGDIDVASSASKYYGATGILAFSANGSAHVDNSGDVSATWTGIMYASARAVDAQGQQGVTVHNSGSLYANGKYAYGVFAQSSGGDVAVVNSAAGDIGFYSYLSTGFGVLGISYTGDVAVSNAGTIEGYAFGQSAGVFGVALEGDVGITNSGSISVISGGDTAVGLFARADIGTATVVNSGDITASDDGINGYLGVAAYGVLARGAYVAVGNSGSVVADGNYYATGIAARSDYGTTVATSASSHIEASAAYVAVGIEGRSEYGDVMVSNAGSISAEAAGAVGIQAYSGGGNVTVANAGHVTADSEYGIALGVSGYSLLGDTTVSNSSVIQANGYFGAYGIYAGAYGNVTVNNSGTVGASAAPGGLAAGVMLASLYGTATLNNAAAGVIGASGDEGYAWAVLGSDGIEVINNSGHINGAISLAGGNDSFNNRSGGVWTVGSTYSTDFGDGNDTLTNLAGGLIDIEGGAIDMGAGNDVIVNNAGGRITLTDGAIHMGAGPGNSFLNLGLITVAGSDNLIDMGAGNTGAFTNVNSINFVNGDTGDYLNIIGNFGGTGALGLDVDLAGHASDQLHVQGNMVAGAAQHVDILFDGMPLTAHTSIDFAHVTGTSVAGSFVPGQILSYNYPRNFLDVDFSIGSRINTANTAADVFSIDLDVVGLLDSGTLAASAATGAANMLNNQIGTFKQRMGVNPYGDAGKVMSAFFRTYTSEGDVSPDHVAANFGQGGNFDYDQSTWGREVGVNANLFGNFHAGVVLGTADGRQRLTGAGVGSNRMNGMTWGVYATWFAPQGYYVDLSGRWMAVDIRSTSAAGILEARAHTSAINLETGYKWTTAGGFEITPQLQYTQTKVEDMTAFDGDRADFKNDGGTSSRARLGVEFSKAFHTAGGMTITPYGSINAIREFDGEMTYTVADNFVGATSTEGTSSMAELGLGIQKGGWGVTLGANWVDGGAFKSTVGGQALVRFAW